MRLRFKDIQGPHKARLSEIREGNGIYGPYLRLIFTVIDGELKGYRFSGFVRPSSVRCGKFYKWVTNILGCEPDDELSTDDIVGKGCKIQLSKHKDFYSVTDVMMDEH